MNILQMEDMVKGLPDQILMQEAQAPSGQIPQFLALSEVQRRQEMRQRFQAPPEATVADQIIQGGIASAMPQQAPQQLPAAPQGMPMGQPQAQPPVMMAEGGFIGGAKEFGKAYADMARQQASTPRGLLSFVPGVGGLMAAAQQLGSLRRYFPSTPEATGFGKYFPEMNKAGLSLGRVDTVRADPNLIDPESDALDRQYQALVSSQQNAMYAPFHSTMTGFDPTAGGTYDPGSQVMSSIGGPNIPGGMANGGMVPSGIVRMQNLGQVPYSYGSLTPENLQRMASIFTSMGLYPSGGLNAQSFDRLPLEKRKQLFDLLGSSGVQVEPSTPRPQLGAYGRTQGTQDINLLVQTLDPQGVRTLLGEALNSGDLGAAERIRSAGVGLGKLDPTVADQMFNQITRLRSQEIREADTESFLQERSLQAQQDIAQRESARAAEQARLAERANYLATGVAPPVAAAAPVAADSSPAAGVAPDVTVAGATAPADIVSERLDTSDQAGVLPEFKRGTPPEFLQSLLSRLGGGTSPEAQEAIDLRRSLIEEGLPAPIDLGQFIQAAEQRQLEAKEEAKRMALANVMTSLGVGLLEGDAAAGLQQATKLAGETLREGRKEARAEGQIAEQLRLQAAQQERQNIIDTMKFKSESVDAIANLISGERKADLTNSLQAAQLLVQFQNNQDNLAMELTKQGFSEQKINKELEKAALQSATRIVETLISSGQLEVKDTAEAGRLINQLANQFTGASNEEDLSSNSVDYASLARKNQ